MAIGWTTAHLVEAAAGRLNRIMLVYRRFGGLFRGTPSLSEAFVRCVLCNRWPKCPHVGQSGIVPSIDYAGTC